MHGSKVLNTKVVMVELLCKVVTIIAVRVEEKRGRKFVVIRLYIYFNELFLYTVDYRKVHVPLLYRTKVALHEEPSSHNVDRFSNHEVLWREPFLHLVL